MELNLIADFYHRYENRNIRDTVSDKNALWLEFNINQLVKFEIASRLKPIIQSGRKLQQNNPEKQFILGVSFELIFQENYADQISIDFLYKLNDNTHFTTNIWADLRNNKISRFKLGIDKISNTNWMTSYSINYRKDQRRGDDLSFDIGLKLISY